MSTSRTTGWIVALLIAAVGPGAAADEPSRFAGRVLDAFGNGIPRVEVLVIERGPVAAAPVATSLSDEQGYFSFGSLLPGAYRIAALKDGYLTFVGAIDTAARRSVQLVLQPASDVGGSRDPLPDDASWALRLPRRSLLRETGNAPADVLGEERLDHAGQSARLEVDQSFGVSPSPNSSSSGEGIDSNDTRVRLALALGERGSLALSGASERHQTGGTGNASADRSGRAMRVDVQYEAVPGGHLDVNAFYETREFSLIAGAPAAADTLQQQQGSLGYDASWRQRIDERSEFAFGVEYTDIWLESPSALTGRGRGSAAVGSRVVGAAGAYRRHVGASHEISLSARARLLEWPQLEGIGEAPTGRRSRRPDLDVTIDAEDRWAVGAPWTIVYGLGHRESLVEDGLQVTEPRVGAIWAAGDWRVTAEVSYHAVDRSRLDLMERVEAATDGSYEPRSDLGYEATVDVPVSAGVSVHGRLRRSPVEFAHVRYDGPVSGNPIYLSDGAAALSERSVSIVQSSERARTSVEFLSGHAEGRLSAFVPFADPDDGSARDVEFDSARVGVQLPSSGTDLALEYRRLVSERAEIGAASDAAVLRSLEMRVRKQLWDVASTGDWRLLIALSLDAYETRDLDLWRAAGSRDDAALDALNRRISAGVSVAF